MLQPFTPARALLLLLAVTAAEAQPTRGRRVTVAAQAGEPLPEVSVAAGYTTTLVLDAPVDRDSVQLDTPREAPRIRLVDVGANSLIFETLVTPGSQECQEVMGPLTVGRVVLARFPVGGLPNPQLGPRRHWGSAQEVPEDSRPVFIIPWRHKPPLLPSQQAMLEQWAKERPKPHEKHHIFPRAFKEWFVDHGIDIDEFVIPLEAEKHRSIHKGERGGPWNAAWDRFIKEHGQEVSKEEIYRHAGQLIYEFQLFGPVVPYWKQPPPLPPGY